MRIIKHGDLKSAKEKINKTRRFECLVCGAIFECDSNEYRYVGGQYDEHPMATCPTCGQDVERTIVTRVTSR